jgi:hypothetical protein
MSNPKPIGVQANPDAWHDARRFVPDTPRRVVVAATAVVTGYRLANAGFRRNGEWRWDDGRLSTPGFEPVGDAWNVTHWREMPSPPPDTPVEPAVYLPNSSVDAPEEKGEDWVREIELFGGTAWVDVRRVTAIATTKDIAGVRLYVDDHVFPAVYIANLEGFVKFWRSSPRRFGGG